MTCFPKRLAESRQLHLLWIFRTIALSGACLGCFLPIALGADIGHMGDDLRELGQLGEGANRVAAYYNDKPCYRDISPEAWYLLKEVVDAIDDGSSALTNRIFGHRVGPLQMNYASEESAPSFRTFVKECTPGFVDRAISKAKNTFRHLENKEAEFVQEVGSTLVK